MTWEPSTRGVSPSENICHFGACSKLNLHMAFYVVDGFGVRYFCEKHWCWVARFIRTVKRCESCWRNHKADFYKDERTIMDVKHEDRWWTLCQDHFDYYNDEICLFSDDLLLPED